jgi:outer membrane receptor protein involved in Fe transport
MPGYTYLNAFVSLQITKGFFFSVNGNNILNTIGITESESGSITEGQVNYIAARSITGRSFSASLRYNF